MHEPDRHKPKTPRPATDLSGTGLELLHGLYRLPGRLLDALCAGRADYRAFQRRKATSEYQARRGHCKSLWLAAGLVILLHPTVAFALVVGLLATLFCFAWLDETR